MNPVLLFAALEKCCTEDHPWSPRWSWNTGPPLRGKTTWLLEMTSNPQQAWELRWATLKTHGKKWKRYTWPCDTDKNLPLTSLNVCFSSDSLMYLENCMGLHCSVSSDSKIEALTSQFNSATPDRSPVDEQGDPGVVTLQGEPALAQRKLQDQRARSCKWKNGKNKGSLLLPRTGHCCRPSSWNSSPGNFRETEGWGSGQCIARKC